MNGDIEINVNELQEILKKHFKCRSVYITECTVFERTAQRRKENSLGESAIECGIGEMLNLKMRLRG